MVDAGVALVVLGAALLVAEAHVPSGLLGVTGAAVLAGGAALVLAGLGGGTLVVVAAAAGALVVSGVWVAIAASKGLQARRPRLAAGREALSGRRGVVRSWEGPAGQVFVDGALWQARPSWPDEPELAAGDAVVVERVSGLTLAVRRAEEWEDPW